MYAATDFLGYSIWQELARVVGLRRVAWNVKPTPALLRRWLKRTGLSVEEYKSLGWRTLQDSIDLNSDWPLGAFIGLMLEEATWKRSDFTTV